MCIFVIQFTFTNRIVELTNKQFTIMDTQIPDNIYNEIEEMISSDQSVVGIDAKKTHVIILYKLMEIEKRLKKLETGNSDN